MSEEKYIKLLNTAKQDRLFAAQIDGSYSPNESGFAFGEEVADVFDNMIPRSVPYYLDLQMLTASIAKKFFQEGSAIYDLGCSTGTALALIAKRVPEIRTLYGIDTSLPMLSKAKEKLTKLQVIDQITLSADSFLDIDFLTSSFIYCNYTLQFTPIETRGALLKKICRSLLPHGAFLLTEKTSPSIPTQKSELIRELHEDYKYQNGYSNIEIARKRDSLKGVMNTLSEEENISLMKDAGFKEVVEVMRGYSFVSWLGLS